MSGQIECNHSVAFREIGNLIAPVTQVAAPAVNQNQRVFTFAVTLVMNARAVELRILRLAVRKRTRLLSQQAVRTNKNAEVYLSFHNL